MWPKGTYTNPGTTLYVAIILQEANQTFAMIFSPRTCVPFPKDRLVKTMAAFVTYLLFY